MRKTSCIGMLCLVAVSALAVLSCRSDKDSEAPAPAQNVIKLKGASQFVPMIVLLAVVVFFAEFVLFLPRWFTPQFL